MVFGSFIDVNFIRRGFELMRLVAELRFKESHIHWRVPGDESFFALASEVNKVLLVVASFSEVAFLISDLSGFLATFFVGVKTLSLSLFFDIEFVLFQAFHFISKQPLFFLRLLELELHCFELDLKVKYLIIFLVTEFFFLSLFCNMGILN